MDKVFCQHQNSPDILSELTPALVGIHRQIMEKKLPTDFTYKGLTAPWMQISIFRLLRHSKSHDPIVGQLLQETLGACKENLSESMTAALVCECVETLLHHTSGETVLNQAMPLVLQLLHHSNTNIKYVPSLPVCSQLIVQHKHQVCPVTTQYAGLCLLEVLLSHYKLPLSLEQQSDIMSGLQHPDHSFRVKTLELLCSAATCSSAHTVSSQKQLKRSGLESLGENIREMTEGEKTLKKIRELGKNDTEKGSRRKYLEIKEL
uniref:Uncharacterized protein n=1 Tax=Timema douglasi TaxID=61478 RepID=A0A7R8ZCN1_TIMDO|nr:unnamed protein product [Timema douglasi]